MAQASLQMPHKLTLNERSSLTVTGVTEVISFDEGGVILRTDLGTLIVRGSGLQLKTLSPEGGQVAVDGQMSALYYEENRVAGGFFRRLLR